MGNSTEIARHDPYGFRRKAHMKADTLVITAASAATMGASRTSIFATPTKPHCSLFVLNPQ